MTLDDLLKSLTEDERDYIAAVDYGNDVAEHREALDVVISRGGTVDMAKQYWFPYEVIELCKNSLKDGHERECVACLGIVFKNILDGTDKSNDIDDILDHLAPELPKLSTELRSLIDGMIPSQEA